MYNKKYVGWGATELFSYLFYPIRFAVLLLLFLFFALVNFCINSDGYGIIRQPSYMIIYIGVHLPILNRN